MEGRDRRDREERLRIEQDEREREKIKREEERQNRAREEAEVEKIEREKKMDVTAENWVLKVVEKRAVEAKKPSFDTLQEAERQSQEAKKELEAYLEHSPMSVSLNSLLKRVLARGTLVSKPEPRPKTALRAPTLTTTPKKKE